MSPYWRLRRQAICECETTPQCVTRYAIWSNPGDNPRCMTGTPRQWRDQHPGAPRTQKPRPGSRADDDAHRTCQAPRGPAPYRPSLTAGHIPSAPPATLIRSHVRALRHCGPQVDDICNMHGNLQGRTHAGRGSFPSPSGLPTIRVRRPYNGYQRGETFTTTSPSASSRRTDPAGCKKNQGDHGISGARAD
jgi:hypothetical protein